MGEQNGCQTRVLSAERQRTTTSMNIVSEIPSAFLWVGTVLPSGDGSQCGRHAVGTSCSDSLPRTRHDLFPLPFPTPQPATALVGWREHINTGPDLGRRTALQMLMWLEVVSDSSNLLSTQSTSLKKIGVSSCTFKKEERGFNSVNEEPVWFDVALAMVVPFAGERMVPVCGRQWFFGLEMVNDGFEFVDIVTAFLSALEVLEKTGGGFDEEQGLGACVGSECSKVLEGRQAVSRDVCLLQRRPACERWES